MKRNAFTITELLISIAIALILIFGIATVFRMTGETIGMGMAMSSTTRDQRAAQTVLASDFKGLKNTNPGLVIWSGQTYGYLDSATRDQDPTRDAAMDGRVPFRTDRLGMFVAGDFRRQSGDENFITSGPTAEQAYVWYGHLVLPDNAGNRYYNPPTDTQEIRPGSISPAAGATFSTNPNNYFARQWALGRVAILLKQKATAITGNGLPSNSYIVDPDGPASDNRQNYYDDDYAAAASLDPLAFGDKEPIYGNAANPTAKNTLVTSRYDLGATTDDPFVQFAARLALPANNLPAANGWWNQFDYRFHADPFPPRPLAADGAARTAPIFLPGATQFITEFAGDYLIQNWDPDGNLIPDEATDFAHADYAKVLGPGQDQRIDLVRVNRIQHIRFYGFPRDVDGDGLLTEGDVVPYKWVIAAGAAFERNEGEPSEFDDKPSTFPSGTTIAPFSTNRQYVTAWAPPLLPETWPKLIRVVYTLQDAQGRLANVQPAEMVFKVN